MKFQIGDKVRTRCESEIPMGAVGYIEGFYGNGEFCGVRFRGVPEMHTYHEDALDLVTSVSAPQDQGVKHDNGKAPISLIPVEAILGEADVFAFGAKKYGKHNFRLGMEHTRVLDAALRHVLAILKGEDVDPESGKPHWAHARCCLAMYAYYQTNQVGKDDRYKPEGGPNER